MVEPFQMVNGPAGLRALVERVGGEPCVALDTEFVWERTYYARLGLVQAALSDGACFLIDPLALPELASLGGILSDTRIVKILHDAPQDLMLLRRATGASAHRVFDTRLAAGFAGLSSVTSLSGLLSEVLGVHLPKEHTRTDWLARPLSPQVLEYAADDVRHLPRLADVLRARAREAQVEAWLDEELAALDGSALYEEKTPAEVYLRIRGAESLPPRNLAVLRELAAWREERARELDLPRRWLAEDHELMSVALALPRTLEELRRCRRVSPQTVRRHGAALVAAVERGESGAAPPLLPRNSALKAAVDAALLHIRTRATGRKIDPQLVGTRNEVAALVQAGAGAQSRDHRLLRGWRAELLGKLT